MDAEAARGKPPAGQGDAETVKLLKRLLIAATVLLVLLAAGLVGTIYGLVALVNSTKVSQPGNFITARSTDQAALVGGAVITHTSMHNPADMGILKSSGLLQRRSSDNYTSGLAYHSTITRSAVDQACQFYRHGLTTVGLHSANKSSGRIEDSTHVDQVHFEEVDGCPALGTSLPSDISNISGVVTVNSLTLHLACNSSACAAYHHEEDQGAVSTEAFYDLQTKTALLGPAYNMTGTGSIFGNLTSPPAGNTTSGRRRQLLAAAMYMCFRTFNDNCCGMCWDGWIADGRCGCKEIQNWGSCAVKMGGDKKLCCLVCKAGWFVDGSCGCKKNDCFPGEAQVQVQGRGGVRMSDLAYGDRVLAVERGSGQLVWREVFLFGHRERVGPNTYVAVKTAAGQLLKLSPRHFIPVCTAGCHSPAGPAAYTLQPKYAGELQAGELVAVQQAGGGVALSAVVDTWLVTAEGAYNPFVRGADLVVDGVVASPHSNWLLDGVAPATLRKHLPAVYEVLLVPVWWLYRLVGPATAEWLAHGLGLAEAGASSWLGAGYFAALRGCGAALAAPLVAARFVLALSRSGAGAAIRA